MRKKTFPANRSYGPTDPNDRPPATSRRDVMSTRDTSALTKTGAIRNTSGSQAVCRRNRIMSASFDPMPVHNGARLRPLHRLWQQLRVRLTKPQGHEDHKAPFAARIAALAQAESSAGSSIT